MSDIIDGTNKKPKRQHKMPSKKSVIILASAAAVVIVAFVCLSLFRNNNTSSDTDSSDAIYQQLSDEFSKKGISYTEQDYEKDKPIIDKSIDPDTGVISIDESDVSNLSDAYQQMLADNDTALNSANEAAGIDTSNTSDGSSVIPDDTGNNGTTNGDTGNSSSDNSSSSDSGNNSSSNDNDGASPTSTLAIQKYIINKVSTMTSFINSSYGWSTDAYGDPYDSFRDYISSLDKYAQNGTSMENWYEGQYTLDEQATLLRYCAYTSTQYTISTQVSGVDFLLKNWYAAGHPSFTKIYSISFTQSYITLSDDVTSSLQASIVTDNGSYLVYLTPRTGDDGSSYYELIDIKQL